MTSQHYVMSWRHVTHQVTLLPRGIRLLLLRTAEIRCDLLEVDGAVRVDTWDLLEVNGAVRVDT